mgnify:CR=1 FL=1
MLERWYPTAHVPSVFAIDYEKLAALGYKGILFDIDNTLVHHGDDSTPEVDALFRHIHSLELKTLLLSDNSAARIERFNRNIRTLFIAEAGKPDPAAYRRASASATRCSGISAARTALGWTASWWISSGCPARRTMAKSVCWKKPSSGFTTVTRAAGAVWTA